MTQHDWEGDWEAVTEGVELFITGVVLLVSVAVALWT
jgi:hypothetical protein